MQVKKQNNNFAFTLFLLLAISAIYIANLYYLDMNLFFDEAQYWAWSKSLDFGYYSKPPMVAWMIYTTTSVCGDSEICIRASSIILHFLTSIVIYKIAVTLYNRQKAFYASLTYITIPAVILSSTLVSTDPSLLFFYALSLLFFIKAIKENTWKYWLLSGLFAGLGMLSKYNMILFLVSSIMFLIMKENTKQHLYSVKFYAAIFVAALIFSPNIFWNIQNGMVSFLHTGDNAKGGGLALQPINMLEFVGAQFGVFGPILFASLLIILSKIKSNIIYEEERLLIWFILPLFILITSISILSRAHANWAAPIYVPATILVVSWLIDKNKKYLLITSLIIHIFVASIFFSFKPIIENSNIVLSGKTTNLKEGIIKDPFLRLRGWEDLGNSVKKILQAYPDAILLTESRKIHAELLYYSRPLSSNAVKWNVTGIIGDHYDLTSNAGDLPKGSNFIFVTRRNNLGENFSPYFQNIERIGNIEINPHKDRARDYFIYYLQGFKTYGK